MPPLVRKDGEMQPLEAGAPALDAAEMIGAARADHAARRTARSSRERHDTDFAYEITGLARFRANMFMDRKGPGAVFRVIPAKILTAEAARPVAAHPQALQADQGARAGHRPDRIRQVDDAAAR